MPVDKAVMEIIIKARDDAAKVLKESQSSIEKYSGSFKKAGAIVSGASLAMGAGLLYAAKSASEERATINRLGISLGNIGVRYDDVKNSMEGWINAQQFKTGTSDEEQRMSIARLIDVTEDSVESQWLLQGAMDTAAGTGKSLPTVIEAIIQAYNGQTGALNTLGIEYDETAPLVENLNTMFTTNKDLAELMQTPMGRLTDEFSDLRDKIGNIVGEKLNPLIDRFSLWLDELIESEDPLLNTIANWTIWGTVIGSVAGPLLLVIGYLPNILAGLRLIGTIIKTITLFMFTRLIPAILATTVALLTNPWTWISVAILLVIAFIAWLVLDWENASKKIRNIFENEWAWIIPGGSLIKSILKIQDTWITVWDGISDGWPGTVNLIIKGINWLIDGFNNLFSITLPSWLTGGEEQRIGLPAIPHIPLMSIPQADLETYGPPVPYGPYLSGSSGGISASGSQITIPVYIGQRKIEEIIVDIFSKRGQLQRAFG